MDGLENDQNDILKLWFVNKKYQILVLEVIVIKRNEYKIFCHFQRGLPKQAKSYEENRATPLGNIRDPTRDDWMRPSVYYRLISE